MGTFRRVLRSHTQEIDLDQLTAVWYRQPGRPEPDARIQPEDHHSAIAGECEDVAEDLWNSLDCLIVPAPRPGQLRAQLKGSQLKIAGELGFELPPTLITNSPSEFLDFYREHHGRVISKMAGHTLRLAEQGKFARFTEAVSNHDLGYVQAIRYCPIIFHAYVPKHIELRITVVGRKVFAAEIHSQTSNHA